jgi:CRISPR-associated protein Csb2
LLTPSPEQPAPSILSGHIDGVPPTPMSQSAHVALIGLPASGFVRADGALHGLALVLPDGIEPADEALVRDTLRLWRQAGAAIRTRRHSIALGDEVAEPTYSMRGDRWVGPSTRWATATPIVLDRFPRRTNALDIGAEVIAASCQKLGLPLPISIGVSNDPVVAGSRPVRSFPPYTTPMGRRPAVHAVIEFDRPIEGPLLIGAGRYFGLGLCVPLDALDGSGEEHNG